MTLLKLLVLNGADVNVKNNDNWAPIHLAVRRQQEFAVTAIIDLNFILDERDKAEFDLNITGGAHEWTSLHIAANASHIGIIETLVDAGADIFLRNAQN